MMHTARGRSSVFLHSAMLHAIWMSGLAVVVLIALLAVGKPLGEAVLLGILLSCPLMMIVKPFMHSKTVRTISNSPKGIGKS